jgi:hypothetical protein
LIRRVLFQQSCGIEDLVVLQCLLDVHLVSRILGQQPVGDLARVLDQRLVMRLAEYEDVLHMQLQPNLRQLLRQLAYPKCHIRELLLCQQPRVFCVLSVALRVLVDKLLLRETLVGLRMVFNRQAIVFFEKCVDDACRGLAAIFRAGRHFARGVWGERGFATMPGISAFEDDLSFWVSV